MITHLRFLVVAATFALGSLVANRADAQSCEGYAVQANSSEWSVCNCGGNNVGSVSGIAQSTGGGNFDLRYGVQVPHDDAVINLHVLALVTYPDGRQEWETVGSIGPGEETSIVVDWHVGNGHIEPPFWFKASCGPASPD